jgi:hypothetical protein
VLVTRRPQEFFEALLLRVVHWQLVSVRMSGVRMSGVRMSGVSAGESRREQATGIDFRVRRVALGKKPNGAWNKQAEQLPSQVDDKATSQAGGGPNRAPTDVRAIMRGPRPGWR